MRGIDLFCGIGGFHIAMAKSGIEVVLASDIDIPAATTYEHNFGVKPHGDICKIQNEDIPSHDILCAGFPCQPFSYAGLGQGFSDQTRGTLFFEIMRIAKHHRPKVIFLENVKGLKSHASGKTMDVIFESLDQLGYSFTWNILNSYHYGLPQYRERWFCVAFLDENAADRFKWPSPENQTPVLRDIMEEKLSDPRLALSDFEVNRINYHFQTAQKGDRVEHDNSKYDPGTKKGKHGVFSFQKPDGSLRFHVGDRAKTQIQEAFYCCLDTYAPTIIANRTPKLWDLGRKMSVREAARLQGFPENFEFPVSDNQAYKQLGNSVAVPVVQRIMEEIIKALVK